MMARLRDMYLSAAVFLIISILVRAEDPVTVPPAKYGRCPTLIDINPEYCATNVSECTSDLNCNGVYKCCSDGCSDVCTPPAYSACEQQLISSNRRAKALGDESVRKPKCLTDGEFDPIQCDPIFNYCYCVNKGGFEIPGTRAKTRELVNCTAPRFCSGLMCRMLCPYDFELDEDGCPLCQCRDPCSGVKCPGNQQCQLEDVSCDREPCPPVPTCKQARSLDTICPFGEPLYLSEKSKPFLCGLEPNKPQCPPFFTCVVQPNMDYGTCCPSLDKIEKPGKCPSASNLTKECGVNCTNDMDCLGLKKCCLSDVCGSHCVESNTSACEQQRLLAELLSQNEKADHGYVPECTESGEFKLKQCSRNKLVCWCVDKKGKKLSRTMGPANEVDCSTKTSILSSPLCDEVICNTFCEYGFKLDAQGCQTCDCADPCDEFVCPENTRCVIERNETCIESFCLSIPRCEAIPQQIPKKPGSCPSIDVLKCFNGSISCTEDNNCQGNQKCCPHECGLNCVDPVKPDRLPTMCEFLRDYARSVSGTPIGNSLAYEAPECSADGLYEQIQCDTIGNCWCVDEFGNEIPKTREASRDLVDCQTAQARFNCLGLMCRLGCDYGFVRDENGCPVCECRNPCDASKCPEGMQCELIEVADVCTNGYCPPVPQCVFISRSLNPCSMGEPLQNHETDTALICGASSNVICPETHYCQNIDETGVCCLKQDFKMDACNLPKEVGNCSVSQLRWFYNRVTGRCESFVYSGCQGNLNNFASQEQCENTCIVNLDGFVKEGSCPALKPSDLSNCADECISDSECPGPQKCCQNDCGAYTCLDPEGSTGKSGQCPFLIPTTDENCDLECISDYDCEDDIKCCSNGCGTSCVDPELKTACEHHKALIEYKIREAGIPAGQVFIPRCRDEDGGYAQIQCHPTTHICWCVDEYGWERPGTRAPHSPHFNCSVNPLCRPLECGICPYGFKLDENGCPECTCHDPCDNVRCKAGEECRLEQLQCISDPCPPLPMCLPKLENPCPYGEPFQDIESNRLLQCGPQGTQCPSTHKCHLSPLGEFAVCCPKPRDVCIQPMEAGSCNTSISRWYFNPVKNTCEEFTYGGCGGNLNNFQTKEDCESICPVLSTCERVRERNLKILKLSNREVFIPKCNRANGAWEPIQCLHQLGLCWCVTKNGDQLPGTLVRGVPECTARMGRKLSDSKLICPENVTVHVCESKLCDNKVCFGHPNAVCRIDPCGSCTARFYDENNELVDCNKDLTSCQKDLQMVLNSEAWANQGVPFKVSSIDDLIKLGIITDPEPLLEASENIPSFAMMNEKKLAVPTDDTIFVSVNLHTTDTSGHPLSLESLMSGINMATSLLRTFSNPVMYKPGACPKLGITSFLMSFFTDATCKTAARCSFDTDCKDEQKCCRTHCGQACVDPMPTTKSGMCPNLEGAGVSLLECIMSETCAVDADCFGKDKCCSNVCGKICVSPIEEGQAEARVSEVSLESTTEAVSTDFLEPIFMSVSLPRCTLDGSYASVQGEGELQWCVTSEGAPVANSLTIGEIRCSENGSLSRRKDNSPLCNSGRKPKICKNECLQAICPAHPDAVCKADPCDNCKVTFYNTEDEKVLCEDKCTQPLETSMCRASFPRWFYNQTSQECEEFIFGGCLGNDNNFETFEECSANCYKPIDKCQQPKRIGMCRASIKRWYFNSITHKCDIFYYGGCDGNNNNFETQEECEAQCPNLVLCPTLDLNHNQQACSRINVCHDVSCADRDDLVCTVDPCNNCSIKFVDLDGMEVECKNIILPLPRGSTPKPTISSTTDKTIPIPKSTRCQKQKLAANNYESFKPVCDKDGQFEPKQCDITENSIKVCWCVDEAGMRLETDSNVDNLFNDSLECDIIPLEKVEVTLMFPSVRSNDDTNSVENIIMDLLKHEDGIVEDEIDIEVMPDVTQAKFSLIGNNKVDVAFELEQKINSSYLEIPGQERKLQLLSYSFDYVRSVKPEDQRKASLSPETVAVIIIFALLAMIVICSLTVLIVMYRRKRMGSYPKGSMESIASSTAPICGYDPKKLSSVEINNMYNDMLDDRKFDISNIEHEYAVITTKFPQKQNISKPSV